MTAQSSILKLGELYVVRRLFAVVRVDGNPRSVFVKPSEKIVVHNVWFEFEDKEKGTIGAYSVLTKSGTGLMIASGRDVKKDLQEYDEWLTESEQERAFYKKLLEELQSTESSSKTT